MFVQNNGLTCLEKSRIKNQYFYSLGFDKKLMSERKVEMNFKRRKNNNYYNNKQVKSLFH